MNLMSKPVSPVECERTATVPGLRHVRTADVLSLTSWNGHTAGVIVDCAAYVNGKRVDVDPRPQSLARWSSVPTELNGHPIVPPDVEEDGFVWLGLRMPSELELGAVCESLAFDEVSPSELLAPHARPVLSLDGPTLQMVVRTARYDDAAESIVLGEMTVLVGPKAVVSIRHGHASPLGQLRVVLEHDPERMAEGPMAVLAAIVGRVIADYSPALDGFEGDAVEVERDVFSETRDQPVRRLYKLKREVRELLVAIDSLQDPLNRLIRNMGPLMTPAVLDDLAEAADQLDRTVVRTQSLSGLLDAALTASLAQISVQQNEDMRKISAWVAMAAVPTLVAGIYGMNFDSFPELHWRYGYPLVLGIMGLIVAMMYRSFKRGGWF
jgi:magnesium transporter